MSSKVKSYLAILMGIVIIVMDIFWLVYPVEGFYSYQAVPWLVAAIVILIASIVWIVLDFSLMEK
jgi:hypothetical protein